MSYSIEVLRRAKARLAQAKTERETEYERQLELAYRKSPRLKEIEQQLRSTVAKVAAASFRSGKDPAEAMAKVREENLKLQQEREWIIESEELELDDSPVCEICGGTGYVGASMCSCLAELCRQEQKKELTSLFGTGRETFETFRLTCYPEARDPVLGVSPRAVMKQAFQKCKRYAQTFTHSAGNMLFSGGTGLGKTFLSAAIARVVADSGNSVVYVSATGLFSHFESLRFGNGAEADQAEIDKYMNCDLLIIDDLGTEMTNQFINSALYQVVNTRLTGMLPTIISTNLTEEDIRRRYSPQIASRLLGCYERVIFVGNDIRMMRG